MNWQQANQEYLMAALARVRHALGLVIARAGGSVDPAAPSAAQLEDAIAQAESRLQGPAALGQLCRLFDLTPFERDLLLLCAGPELDSEFARLCASAQGDSHRPYATFELAMACLPNSHWNAILPAAPLRYWRMVEVATPDSLVRSPLRVDERILHFLAGARYLDERLESLLRRVAAGPGLSESHSKLAERTVGLLANGGEALPLIALTGPELPALKSIASEVCARLGLGLYALRASEIPQPATERAAFARLWEREAALSGAALLVELADGDDPHRASALVDRFASPVFLAGRWALSAPLSRPVVRVNVERPIAIEQQAVWRETLGARGASLNGYVPALITQFDLSAPAIRAVCAEALTDLPVDADTAEVKGRLWNACRAQARPRLDDLAARIETRAQWEDLVLPEPQWKTLREIVAHARHRHTVYETWGFAARGNRGLGTGVVFAGPSGTGKTLAAEVMANALKLDLYRIDLSSVVSKYIGETEKNLRRIFDAAESGGAILLFDEADALFGKRSEVKDSHDRYANIEVSFLLQQMEAYRGLAILTTNMLNAFDPAFLRRIRFIVQFPFPAIEQRAAIWSRVFPPDAPTEEIDVGKLARLNLAGGNIRNIAVNAAFLAAEDAGPVRMRHLLDATISECAKLEKPLTGDEINDWVREDAD